MHIHSIMTMFLASIYRNTGDEKVLQRSSWRSVL